MYLPSKNLIAISKFGSFYVSLCGYFYYMVNKWILNRLFNVHTSRMKLSRKKGFTSQQKKTKKKQQQQESEIGSWWKASRLRIEEHVLFMYIYVFLYPYRSLFHTHTQTHILTLALWVMKCNCLLMGLRWGSIEKKNTTQPQYQYQSNRSEFSRNQRNHIYNIKICCSLLLT